MGTRGSGGRAPARAARPWVGGMLGVGGMFAAILAVMFVVPAAVPQAGAQTAPLPPTREQPAANANTEAALPGPGTRTPPPGYERDLLRLSEVLGSLAFLRTLCAATDAPQWRERMAALMESEARDAATRATIAGAFNQGFRAFAITYRTCTPAAQAATARYLSEGERLTRAVASRFGE